MSRKYDEYLEQHIQGVFKAYEWLRNNVPDLFVDPNLKLKCDYLISNHDKSKYDKEEYQAYDDYFYGNRSYKVVQDFNRAWLHHIHKNQHHWQYWVLINDDPNENEVIIDMPDEYIIEMICDWLSFSLSKDNLYELFDWYNQHKNYMKLSDKTRDKVEYILDKIKEVNDISINFNTELI